MQKLQLLAPHPTPLSMYWKQLYENNFVSCANLPRAHFPLYRTNIHGRVSPYSPKCCFLQLFLLFPSHKYSATNSHLPLPQGQAPKIVLIFTQYSSFPSTNQTSYTFFYKTFRTSTAPSKTQPCTASCCVFAAKMPSLCLHKPFRTSTVPLRRLSHAPPAVQVFTDFSCRALARFRVCGM